LEARKLMEEHLRQAQTAQETEPSGERTVKRTQVKRKKAEVEPRSQAT